MIEKLINWAKRRKISLSIILVHSAITIITSIFFYPIIPEVLNYAPGVINKYDTKWLGISYFEQYVIIITFIILIFTVFLVKTLRNMDNVDVLLKEGNVEVTKKITNQCINYPYIIYILQVILPLIFLSGILIIFKQPFNVLLIIFTFATLIALISLIFSKRIFTKVLLKIDEGNELRGIRVSIRKKIFIQMIPLIMVAILFTSLIGYSRLIREKGDYIFEIYNERLDSKFDNVKFNNIGDIEKILRTLEVKQGDCTFIINPKDQTITSDDSSLDKMFINYINDITPQRHDGRAYYLLQDTQGVIKKIKISNDEVIVGIRFQVSSQQTVTYFIIAFLVLVSLNALVLSYFSKSLSEDISHIAKSLTQIVEGGKIENMKHLAITSNDEIGDLVIAFNKIQNLEHENLEQIKQTQNQLLERERLASLGEIAGGVAHDINSPLSSLQTILYSLRKSNDKIKEYMQESQTLNEELTEEFENMEKRFNNGNTACERIAKIVNSVRNHTRNLSGENVQDFNITSVVEDVKILINHHLKSSGCELIINEQSDALVNGDPGKLGQVLTNLIVNAIQAYEEKPGNIEINVEKSDKYAKISVKDMAGGIPEMFREGIFNKMLTTKGTQGTGLGLYLCHSIITGHFGGKISFDTKEGEGTTFYVTIPLKGKVSQASKG